MILSNVHLYQLKILFQMEVAELALANCNSLVVIKLEDYS